MSNVKRKKFFKRLGIGVAIIAILALVGGVAAVGMGSMIERNPDNLIEFDENYLRDTKTNYGLEVKVDDNGVIKLKGETTRNEELIVQTVTLPAGTYTISGIAKPNLAKMVLRATWGAGEQALAGLDSATFTLEEDTVVTVSIVIEGSDGENTIDWANRTIKPVIVEGNVAGDFYK